jgi:hypothetical protein
MAERAWGDVGDLRPLESRPGIEIWGPELGSLAGPKSCNWQVMIG